MRVRAFLSAVVLWMSMVAAPAMAAEVGFSISRRETYVGLPVTVQVKIENAQSHDAPKFPDVDGAEVRFQGKSSQTYIRNGRVSRAVSYTYAIIPRETGELLIPSIRVRADGEWKETQSTTIRVLEAENNGFLYVEVRSERDSVYVGEPIAVTLEIWLKQFAGQGYELDARAMWRCVDAASSSWGPFEEVITTGRNIQYRRDSRADEDGLVSDYFVYSVSREVWTQRPGTFDGDVSIVAQYPVRLRRNRFSLLDGPFSVTETRPVSALVENSSIVVKPLPSQDRPENFRGAVGQFVIDVKAVPTNVSVGDPITITMKVKGTGRPETLQAPPLGEQDSLTADFRVPDEPLAGVVEDGVKTFSQSIRAKRDSVTRIPPIAFAYFDPRIDQYVTIESRPIPITVQKSSRPAVSQLVEGSAAALGATELTLVSDGLLPNYGDIDLLLASQQVNVGWKTLTFVGAWPAAYAAVFLVRRRSRRLRGDTGLVRRRSAHRVAMAALREAESRSDPSEIAARAATALAGYVADRCNLPAGGVTRGDAVRTLRQRNVPEVLTANVDALLAECESTQYAGSVGAVAGDAADRARNYVNALQRAGM